MTNFDVAHIREQGVDLILIPLGRSFDFKTPQEKARILDGLQECASSAGLAGTVVPMWETTGRGAAFIAPRPWHPFLRSVDMNFVARNINRRLTCGA